MNRNIVQNERYSWTIGNIQYMKYVILAYVKFAIQVTADDTVWISKAYFQAKFL